MAVPNNASTASPTATGLLSANPATTPGAVGTDTLDAATLQSLFDVATQQTFRSSGAGSFNALYQTNLSQFDRFGINAMLPNHVLRGYTFITRPKLNLQTASIRADRILSMLDTTDNQSLQYAIRCWLDTKYASRKDMTNFVAGAPFFNAQTPFIIPLSNNLISLSGWPDPVLDTETTDGGFFSEDLTLVKGSDRLNRTYNLTLTFRDIQGGFILALLYYWLRYMELVVRGDVLAYDEDIAARRVNYTFSIYRFVVDPSRQVITNWAKATGCFIKSVPIGNIFNFGERENYLHSAAQYSIEVVANHVGLMDPIILRDFNTISARYCQQLVTGGLVAAPMTADTNFTGLPYIDLTKGTNKIQFMCAPADLINPYATTWAQIQQQIAALTGRPNTVPIPT